MKTKILMLLAIVIIILLYILLSVARAAKTSVVVATYNHTARDGCAGFVLTNGESIDTFCFWTSSEDQTDIEGPINVGDTVEYGTKDGKQFIRLKNH